MRRTAGSTPPWPGSAAPTLLRGSLIVEGRNFMVVAPHIPPIPGIALMIATVATSVLGDGLPGTLNPRLRR